MKLVLFSALAMASTLSGVAFAQVAPATPPVETAPAAGVVAAGGADLAAGFGVLGQLVVSDDIALSFIHQSQGNASGWNINVQPALDFFIAPNISVGGAIAIVHGSSSQSGVSGTDVTLIGIAARAGYALRLTEMLSLWARLSLGYAHTSFSLGSMSFSGYEIPLQIFAPILFHPVQHFFIGVGPIFSFQLANKVEGMSADKQTNIGLQSTIGGYWGK